MTIEEFIEYGKGKMPLQIIEFQNEDISVEVLNGKLKKHITGKNTSYEIKAKVNDKYVTARANYLDKDLLELLEFKSLSIESCEEDHFIEEEKKEFVEKNDFPDVSFEVAKMKKLDSYLEDPTITSVETSYEYEFLRKRIVNTFGLDISTKRINYSFYIEIAGIDGEIPITYDDIIYTSKKDDINISDFSKKAFEKLKKSFNQEKLETKKYLTILSPRFMSCILGEIIPLLSKEQVRKRLSCLEDKLGKRIFSEKLTFIEDAPNEEFPGTEAFDDEGTKTKKKVVIDKGILKTYLYNNKEAIIDKVESTGNGYGSISATNFYIAPSSESEEDLLKKMNNGIYIEKYMDSGGIILNPNNGDISVPVFGYIVKDGKITRGFTPSILTVNLFDLLGNVEAVGKNLEFKTSVTASPSILVRDVSIAG